MKYKHIVASIVIALAIVTCIVCNNSQYRRLDIKDTDYKVFIEDKTGKMKVNYSGYSDYGVIIVEKVDKSKDSAEVNKNTYVLDRGKTEIIGCTYGSGDYKLKVCDYTGGKDLELREEYSMIVKIDNAELPFDGIGYYTNYSDELDKIVQELKYGTQQEYVNEAYKYVADNIRYNKELENKINNGEIDIYKPNLTDIIENKTGICLDKASLLASLCRKEGIPARVVIGYNEHNEYHAWVETYIDEEWLLYDSTLNRKYSDSITRLYKVEKYY